jgi:4-oxalomesaconate tautomerase
MRLIKVSNSQKSIPAFVIRGGTSKGLYFFKSDLPADVSERDALLLRAMGSPDPLEIDGMGGGHPLTSKVAVVSPSLRENIDVDYLFLQVWPNRPEVDAKQNCGNILAGVGVFAIETGLVEAKDGETVVRVFMENTSSIAELTIQTPNREISYEGETRIDGVPGSSSPIYIDFEEILGSTCGALFPTGNRIDIVEGREVTCIDNGMPVVCLKASDFGLLGTESPAEIMENKEVLEGIERVRLAAGTLMGLGDVSNRTVPKMSLLSPGEGDIAINTRTLIPRVVHESIGVLGAVSVATAAAVSNTVASKMARVNGESSTIKVGHPAGFFGLDLVVEESESEILVKKSTLVRTARVLMRGEIYI